MNNPFGRAGEWPNWPVELVDRKLTPAEEHRRLWVYDGARERAHRCRTAMIRLMWRRVRHLLRQVLAPFRMPKASPAHYGRLAPRR